MHKRNKNKYNKISNNEQTKNSLVQTMTNIDIITVVIVLYLSLFAMEKMKVMVIVIAQLRAELT